MTKPGVQPCSLNDCAQVGKTLRVHGLQGKSPIVERLREMGLNPGIEVEYAGQAPFAGPHLLRVGATLIALRFEEAACVLLLP